jgi:hypothetical protein
VISTSEAARHGRGHCLENSWPETAPGFDSPRFLHQEERLDMIARTKSALAHVELQTRVTVGALIVLPAGLTFVNEYTARRSTLPNALSVRIVRVERDELFWRSTSGKLCSARYRRS